MHASHSSRRGDAPASDIVLLEESDLYRYHGADGGFVIHDTALDGDHAKPPQASYAAATPALAIVPPPPSEPVKYARSVHSYRSHRSGGHASNYLRHSTPYGGGGIGGTATRSDKRTASIDTIPAHYGALRPGGPVELFSKRYIGLLLNWVLMGVFQGAIGGLVKPLFGAFLGYDQTQQSATLALFNLGWYFKFIFGFVTDCFPIRRQRRKPYIFIGWTIFMGFMVAMACMKKVEWFGTEDDVRNADAPTQGRRYFAPILISSFAQLMATVACEGLMVEFAHREGEYDRGRTQLWCAVFRFIGEVLGGCFAALSLGSTQYGGEFAYALPLEVFFATLAALALLGNVVTYFWLDEDQLVGTAQSVGSNVRRFWRFIEQRVTLQVMVGLFLLSLAINVSVLEYNSIYDAWLHTSSLAANLVAIFQSAGMIAAAGMIFTWFLNTNWRALAIGGFAIAVVLQLPVEMITVWGVFRSSALMLSKDWVAGIFEGIVWLVRVMIVVETAEPGLESTSYGFLTTVCNLSNMVLTSSFNVAAASWDPESTKLERDTSQVRWHLTYEFIFKYTVRFALTFLACYILPRQKRHLKEIKIRGAPNLILPVLAFLVVALLFAASLTSAFLSMFPSTACLTFAGGSGCDDADDGSS